MALFIKKKKKKNLCHPSNLHVQQVMHVVTILPDFYNCMYESHLRHRGSNGTVVVCISAIVWPVHPHTFRCASATRWSISICECHRGASHHSTIGRRITQRLVFVDKTCTSTNLYTANTVPTLCQYSPRKPRRSIDSHRKQSAKHFYN